MVTAEKSINLLDEKWTLCIQENDDDNDDDDDDDDDEDEFMTNYNNYKLRN